jgi:transposase-like protein
MRVTRPRYTEEFRQDAVALLEGTDRSFKQVAEDPGVSVGLAAVVQRLRSAEEIQETAESRDGRPARQ